MAGEERGFLDRINPISQVRQRWDGARAHPFQTAMSTILGVVNPALGMGSRAAFNRYNDNRFDRSAQRNNARMGEMGDEAGRTAMERPLDGPLGRFEQPRGGQQNPLVQALMGPGGGQQALNSGGYNVQNQWGQSQPQSILGGMPQKPQMGPDLSGLDAAMARANGGLPIREKETGWAGIARGGAPGEMGVMGPGANGQAMIRGVMPMGSPVFNKRRYG
jgi:hypothetical protein